MELAVEPHGRRRPAQPETKDVFESNRAVRRRLIQPDAQPLFDVADQIFCPTQPAVLRAANFQQTATRWRTQRRPARPAAAFSTLRFA